MEVRTIIFTKDKLSYLKRRYNKAVKDKEEVFIFEGKEILTSFAKYLIEYLELHLKGGK
jgi:hypothetical protein